MNMRSRLFLRLILACGVLLPWLVHAGVDTAWVRRYDGAAHLGADATGLAVDSNGDIIVAGVSLATDSTFDWVTIKYLPNGETAWVRTSDFDYGKRKPSGLGVDVQGNVYISGSNNEGRMVTIKYSPTGNQLWHEYSGSQGGANGLVLDSHGNVIVCGSSYRASSDAAYVKYRPNGDTAWARFYDWAGLDDYALAVGCGQADNPVATGYGTGSSTHIDCVTVMRDSTGSQLWAAGYDGPNHGVDVACAVAVDESGNTTVAGYGDNGYGTPPDYLTIKYDTVGETLWTRRYDGPSHEDDEATALTTDQDGNVFVTGYSYDTATQNDYLTVKYDSAGNQMWVARYNGAGNGPDQACAIVTDRLGNAYITGTARIHQYTAGCVTIKYDADGDTCWVATFPAPPLTPAVGGAIAIGPEDCIYIAGGCDGDILVIKYVQSGGVAEGNDVPVARRASLVAEPSVFRTRTALYLCVDKPAATHVALYDAEGRRVRTLTSGLNGIGATTATWDGCDERGKRLSPGVYIVVLEAGGQRVNAKVVMSE